MVGKYTAMRRHVLSSSSDDDDEPIPARRSRSKGPGDSSALLSASEVQDMIEAAVVRALDARVPAKRRASRSAVGPVDSHSEYSSASEGGWPSTSS